MISPDIRAKLDSSFATAVLQDGLSFSTCQSDNWKLFWKLIFGDGDGPPSRMRPWTEFLLQTTGRILAGSISHLRKCSALCVSLDGFSYINSQSVFNLLVGGPIPFHIKSFRLGSRRESAVNVDKMVPENFNNVFNTCEDIPSVKAYGLVTDSPNFMMKARQLCSGIYISGPAFVTFAYGCVCHATSLSLKDMIRLPCIRTLFKLVVNMATYFKNTHLANNELEKRRHVEHPVPRSIKSFSKTRWNGTAVVFQSVIDNKTCIRCLFSEEMWKDTSGALLNIHKSSRAAKTVFNTAQNPEFLVLIGLNCTYL